MLVPVTRSARRRHGAAAAELAIWLPFFVVMFAVALDFCRIFYVTQTIQNCAWVGAMYASGTASSKSSGSAEDAAQQAAVNEAASLNPPVQLCDVLVDTSGSRTTVTVRYDFQALTPLMGDNGTVRITRSVTMYLAPTGP